MEGNDVQHLVESLPGKVEAVWEKQLPVNAKDIELNVKEAIQFKCLYIFGVGFRIYLHLLTLIVCIRFHLLFLSTHNQSGIYLLKRSQTRSTELLVKCSVNRIPQEGLSPVNSRMYLCLGLAISCKVCLQCN